MKKIAIGSDHAGFELKSYLIDELGKLGFILKDFGAFSSDRADYPDFAHPVSEAVEKSQVDFGILICGSANGIAMTANKHQGIRAAICWSEEITSLARLHNDANIMALPARFIKQDLALKCAIVFESTQFEGGRHSDRVAKISC